MHSTAGRRARCPGGGLRQPPPAPVPRLPRCFNPTRWSRLREGRLAAGRCPEALVILYARDFTLLLGQEGSRRVLLGNLRGPALR